MVRQRFLQVAAVSALVLVGQFGPVQSVAAVENAPCDAVYAAAGLCGVQSSGTINGDQAIVSATQPGNGTRTGPGAPKPPAASCVYAACVDVIRNSFTVVTVRLSDLVGFRPAPGVDHMEPNGWTIAGLDTNFYATGGAQEQTGTLLGFPASVRFTPIRWRWSYGDGTTVTRTTRGGTWAAQHIREFDPTPTSHVYQRLGDYVINLSIVYRAEFTFDGSDWATIPGTITVPANPLTITAGSAKTVLVQRECTLNPSGPGC